MTTPHRASQIATILAALRIASLGLTRKEIAALLGIPKTGYVSKLTKELAERDLVIVKRGVDSRRRNVFIYFINDLREG